MQVAHSSTFGEHQASLPDSRENQTSGDAPAKESPLDADLSDSTCSEMEKQ